MTNAKELPNLNQPTGADWRGSAVRYLPNGAILAPKIHLDGVLEATLGTSWAMLAPRFTQDPPRTPQDHQNGAKMLPKLIKN